MDIPTSALASSAVIVIATLGGCMIVDPNTSATETESQTQTQTSSETDTQTDTETGSESICARVELDHDAFYPGGAVVTADGRLLVASTGTGAVAEIEPCASTVDRVAAGGELRNPGGVAIDATRDRLVVCDADMSFATPASLDVFELGSGALVASHVFPAMGFCNDLTFGPDGEVYATDSILGQVVRVRAAQLDAATPVEVWATDPAFAAAPGTFGLNGLAHDGDDQLFVNHSVDGAVLRIAIERDGAAGNIEALALSRPLAQPDGMQWYAGGLLVVELGTSELVEIHLADGGATVQTLAAGFDTPAAVAVDVDGHSAWVVESQIDHLLGLDPTPPTQPFALVRVAL